MKMSNPIKATALLFSLVVAVTCQGAYDHVFIVVLENVAYDAVVGSQSAPYINNQMIPKGTLYTQSYGVAKPSLPNYLALFSGSTQGVTTDKCPTSSIDPVGPFDAPNLYTRLVNNSYSIVGYMNSLPSVGWLGCKRYPYVARHNPFRYFTNVPPATWVRYTKRSNWPNLAWITPDQLHNMHDGIDLPEKISNGDSWLSNHMPDIIDYCAANNGLLILTMDEGPSSTGNRIFTLLIGNAESAGARNNTRIDHYSVLRLVTDNFGVAPLP